MSEHAAVELSPEAIEFADFMTGFATPESELDATRTRVESGRWTRVACWESGANRSTPIPTTSSCTVTPGAPFCRRRSSTGSSPAHIAKAAGAPVLVLDFRRAPEHKYPAQVDDAEAAFNWLLSEGYEPGNIITIGHSIGGFIAVALALRLRDKKQPLPGAIVSISPWCDLEIANETMVTNAGTDKILSKDLLEFFRESWVGGTGIDFTDARINLNRADLSGLPPTLVSWGTYEVLAGEDEEFAARVKDAGIDTTTVVVPGGQHSYVYGAGRIPETDAAIAQIGAWVREKTKI